MGTRRQTGDRTELLPSLAEEQPLARWRAARGKLSINEVVELLHSIGCALIELHATGRTSGALDPAHIFVSTSAQRRAVRIEATRPGKMTPDLARATDVHALGLLGLSLSLGRSPNRGETIANAVPQAPAALDQLIRQMLDPDPTARPQLVEVCEQLSAVLAAAAAKVHKASLLTPLPRLKVRAEQGSRPAAQQAWMVLTRTVAPSVPLGDDEKPTAFVPEAALGDDKTHALKARPQLPVLGDKVAPTKSAPLDQLPTRAGIPVPSPSTSPTHSGPLPSSPTHSGPLPLPPNPRNSKSLPASSKSLPASSKSLPASSKSPPASPKLQPAVRERPTRAERSGSHTLDLEPNLQNFTPLADDAPAPRPSNKRSRKRTR